MMIRFALAIAMCVVALIGCKASTAPNNASARRPDVALEKLRLGTKLLEEQNYAEAEKVLLEALDSDAFCGMAHNNLAMIYYSQGRMYDAAWRFQNAAKLMPYQPEPRNNLGLVLEQTGKVDEAVNAYRQALELEPKNPQLLGNLARARVRRGDPTEDVRPLLEELVTIETRPEWREWAERELSLHPEKPASAK